MIGPFPRIGIFSKPNNGPDITETLQTAYEFLKQRGHQIIFDPISAERLPKVKVPVEAEDKIGSVCDLIMVIGGDGSLLKAARAIVNSGVPILGVNRGSLGFLADIVPGSFTQTLEPILNGDFFAEQRTMLQATVIKNKIATAVSLALNDVVLHHGDVARLIEFQIFIDDKFVVDQRADGIIVSTPTGSTAYALSGGGPIVYPTLDVLTLMPMFPHALNTRPIVIDKNSKIKLVLTQNNKFGAKFSSDGQKHISLEPGDEVHIEANKNSLRLLHPSDYNYFATLREKLGWNVKPHN